MKKIIKGLVTIAGIFLLFISMNAWQDFLHAQDGSTPLTNTEDATNTGDATPDENADQQEITLNFVEEEGKTLSDIKILINNKVYQYNKSDFIDGKLKLNVSKTQPQIIEFRYTKNDDYYFDPYYLFVNENQPDLKNQYTIKAIRGIKEAYTKKHLNDANQEEYFIKYKKSGYLELTANVPMMKFFYKLPYGDIQPYTKPVEIVNNAKDGGTYDMQYIAMRYFPGEEPPTIADAEQAISWMPARFFLLSEKDSQDKNDEQTGNLPFVDKDGKYDVKLNIKELKELDSIQKAIASYKEFKDIPKTQISYLDISLMANTIEVQPKEKYAFIIPYPVGSSIDDEFVIYHFKHGDITQPENLSYIAKSDGLHVTVSDFSPFVIGWKEKVDSPNDNNNNTPPDINKDDQNSDNIDKDNQKPSDTNKGNQNSTDINKPTNSNNSANSTASVTTGDMSTTSLWIITLLFSLAILFATTIRSLLTKNVNQN